MAEEETTIDALTETLSDAGDIAIATSKALGRTILFGTIPLFEFGILVLLTVAIVRLPVLVLRRLE